MQEEKQQTIVEELQAIEQRLHGIIILRNVLKSEAAEAMRQLIHTLATPESETRAIAQAYSDAYYTLAKTAQEDAYTELADAWQAHIMARLLEDNNPWSEQVESLGREKTSITLRTQATRDLQILQDLFQLDAHTVWEYAQARVATNQPALANIWGPWYELAAHKEDEKHDQNQIRTLKRLTTQNAWSEIPAVLEEYWSRYGTGKLTRYSVQRWQGRQQKLVGIEHPDTIQLWNLIGQEKQQERIKANLQRFLAGYPAHDMLLYGSPGTGKSSTIKAFVNAYAEQGLRLIEVKKEDISDLPSIYAQLRGHAPRYLIFIDDLSFEEHETSYKGLKVLLEGTAEARSENILISATTNRMNLIKENFSERGKPADDVNWRDSMDEKQSLVHRFGLRVTFFTPDQNEYLRIVAELAQQRNLEITQEKLQQKALYWERQHSGRSGRSARQFIDDLEAELKIHPEIPIIS